MKALLSAAILFALCTVCGAQKSLEAYEAAMIDLSEEEIECVSFYAIVGICLERDPDSKQLSERALKTQKVMYDRAFAASSEARVMVEAYNAKLDHHSQSSMMAKIKNDCRNLAILLAGHGETCKSLFENHDAHARQLMLEHLNVPR